jgi:hypothetical protein
LSVLGRSRAHARRVLVVWVLLVPLVDTRWRLLPWLPRGFRAARLLSVAQEGRVPPAVLAVLLTAKETT